MEPIFADRTALVTGGARGIGRAICQMLAECGARVAINYQQNDAAARETLAAVEAAGARGCLAQADVADEKAVGAMVASVERALGPVDLLVNNAGIAITAFHNELTFAAWKRMFEVNMDGPFLTTWAVKDGMLSRGFGRIVNISSLAGFVQKPEYIHYATTKAGLISFTRHCAVAFAPHVRVNCVAPGLTDTDLARTANPGVVDRLISVTPLKRIGKPEEMAAAVKFLLSEESSFITGQTISVCGGRV
jgi:3-oxoacyl-[acyl-carrier protein] reductase